jgi:hypothetical protein
MTKSFLSEQERIRIYSSERRVEALTAVHCLSTLFADVNANLLEQVLDDPLLELANADLAISLP